MRGSAPSVRGVGVHCRTKRLVTNMAGSDFGGIRQQGERPDPDVPETDHEIVAAVRRLSAEQST